MEEMERISSRLGPLCLAEIPLLFEAGVPPWVDAVIYVGASAPIRLARLAARGWDETELIRRESFLMPREEKIRRADFLLHNEGSPEDLSRRSRELGTLLRACATGAIVETVCADFPEAERIGRRLAEEGYGARVRISPAGFCLCRGEPRGEREARLELRTLESLFPYVAKRIRELHSDESPAIEMRRIDRADLPTALRLVESCPRGEAAALTDRFRGKLRK
jgi:dephospho-CoA kinase